MTRIEYTRPCSQYTTPSGKTVSTGEIVEIEDDGHAEALLDKPGFREPRCQATTADGDQCERTAAEGDYCAQHAEGEGGG